MANYLDKWKTDFPETVNNQTRPAAGIDNSLDFNTDGFPQRITSDPVHAKLENDMAQQLFSNDQRLKDAIDSAGIKESNHEKASNAHANGIAGNAGSATKLATARTIQTNLASTSAASFNGTTNITPGVTGTLPVGNGGTGQTNLDNVTVGTSKKVHTIVSSGTVGELVKAKMGTNDSFRIAVGGSSNAGYAEIATADDGTEPIYVRQYGDAKSDGFVTPTRTATLLDANGNTQFPGSVTAPSFVGNAASADKWKTARTLSLGGRASGSVSMDGSANVTLNVNDVSLADKATADANGNNISSTYVKSVVNLTTEDLNNICKGGFYQNSLNVNSTSARHYPVDQHACSIIVANNGANGENSCTQICTLFDTHDSYKREYEASTKTWSSWRKYAFVDSTVAKASQLATARTISLTGNATGSANFDGSGNISISTNVNTATNADKLDGYHASDLFRHLGGNQTPVITDIFDRAGTIDMTTMSAVDKATHKANINKANNASQNIWNTDTGIRAYGGDYDIAGYNRGTLKLTQSYKNFDKILVVGANDRGELLIYKLWDVWALANAFAGGSRFQLFHGGYYWFLYGSTRKGTWADYALSTDTVWSCQDQNSAIVAIYGIKY